MRYGQLVVGPAGSGKVELGLCVCDLVELFTSALRVVYVLQHGREVLPRREESGARGQPGPCGRVLRLSR